MTYKEYRYAKKVLVDQGLIKIVVTNRTRKKAAQTQNLFESTFGATERATGRAKEPTTTGTLVELCNSMVWDINSDINNHQKGDCKGNQKGHLGATQGPLKGHKQEGIRRNKKEKENHHPSIPSYEADRFGDDRTTDDFSFDEKKIEITSGVFLTQEEITLCLEIKGSIEKVKHAIEYIQKSEKRKYPIADWPNALAMWKVEDEGKMRIQEHLDLAERLCRQFKEFHHGNGWRCYKYHDHERDQKGLLFECQSAYQEAIFIAFVDGEFQQKCEEALQNNKMNKKQLENIRNIT